MAPTLTTRRFPSEVREACARRGVELTRAAFPVPLLRRDDYLCAVFAAARGPVLTPGGTPVDVRIVARAVFTLRCRECGAAWSVRLTAGLPPGWARCPRGCNADLVGDAGALAPMPAASGGRPGPGPHGRDAA